MAPRARILAIDDQLYSRNLLEGMLAEAGYEVHSAQSGARGLGALETSGPYELVIVDLGGRDGESLRTVSELRRREPEQEIIVLTGVGDVRAVVAAMRQGATDCLLKPIDREGLLKSIESALERRRMRVENARLVDENLQFMGRLSVLERALPLIESTDLESAARTVLELVCVEGGAPEGICWVREPGGEDLLRRATRGDVTLVPAGARWSPEDAAMAAAVERGELVKPRTAAGPADGEALLVPFVHEGRLLGVARLMGGGGRREQLGDVELCQKLGAIALANALRVEELAAASLRDPRTGLPTRAYLEAVIETEIHKAHRFGRRLSCLCVELRGLSAEADPETVKRAVSAMARTLRTTDVLASEAARRFWVLVTDTDALGGVVLKRRLDERIRDALRAAGLQASASLGVAGYPLDGETGRKLIDIAAQRADRERGSLVHELGLDARSTLAEIGDRLLECAEPVPGSFITEAAELLVGELTCRPRDRGLLFLAPGTDRSAVLGPLSALGDTEIATEVFIATDGDTVPAGPRVTAVGLPPDVSERSTWIVRFGEAPAYALVAGAPGRDGTRPVFHTADPVLVEHMTFRLRAEVGFGVHS